MIYVFPLYYPLVLYIWAIKNQLSVPYATIFFCGNIAKCIV